MADTAVGPSEGVPVTRSRTASTRARLRRLSTNERITEILETGRDRADGLGPDPASIMRRQSSARPAADNSETVAFATRGTSHDYQAVGGPTRNDSNAGASTSRQDHWWSKFRSIELENKGSVARDHLALERTFLAWLRTSLAFASIGIAVTQLFRLNKSLQDAADPNETTLRKLGKPLGSTFLGISILILILGAKRYFHGQEWIINGKFPASRGTIILVALVALAIMLVSLVVVIVIHPTDEEL